MGMTSARTWAHSISELFPFQTAPGQYDENGLKALDYVIDSARRHGIKLILSFIDNWKYYNGVDQYVDWCGPARTMQLPKDEHGGDTDTRVSRLARVVGYNKVCHQFAMSAAFLWPTQLA